MTSPSSATTTSTGDAPHRPRSIRQPRDRIGAEAIRLILAEESAENAEYQHEQVRLAPELVIRATTTA